MRKHNAKSGLPLPRPEPGWLGSFVRTEADGAIPNGTVIVKVATDEGDANPSGAKGRVLGSMRHPEVMDNELLYFVEWENSPKVAVACIGRKIATP